MFDILQATIVLELQTPIWQAPARQDSTAQGVRTVPHPWTTTAPWVTTAPLGQTSPCLALLGPTRTILGPPPVYHAQLEGTFSFSHYFCLFCKLILVSMFRWKRVIIILLTRYNNSHKLFCVNVTTFSAEALKRNFSKSAEMWYMYASLIQFLDGF